MNDADDEDTILMLSIGADSYEVSPVTHPFHGMKAIRVIHSSGDAGRDYVVIGNRDQNSGQTVFCTCKAYRYRYDTLQAGCKHAHAALRQGLL